MISAVVSGSFKFKPEIDKTIDILTETGVSVLEPTKGWLRMSGLEIAERLAHGLIRPLPTEERLDTKQIEERFLRALAKASLLYVMNPEGYVGNSVNMEIGFALSRMKPIYSLEPLGNDIDSMEDLELRHHLTRHVTVLSPENVGAHFQQNFQRLETSCRT